MAVPGSAEYNRSLSTYYAAQEADIQPLCIVQPETAEDVAATVETISTTADTLPRGDTRTLQCRFAVRSGGHGVNAGQANIAGGVTIDLRGLDSIEVDGVTARSDNGEKVISVGPGATWDQVYDALEPLGLMVAGGRNAGVGVGGLTTGGGISFFSPRRGWTCDDAVAFEIVLANSTIARARAESWSESGTGHEGQSRDLLTALRGGGSSANFGIVTRVGFRAFEQGLLWGGGKRCSNPDASNLIYFPLPLSILRKRTHMNSHSELLRPQHHRRPPTGLRRLRQRRPLRRVRLSHHFVRVRLRPAAGHRNQHSVHAARGEPAFTACYYRYPGQLQHVTHSAHERARGGAVVDAAVRTSVSFATCLSAYLPP